MKILCRMRRVLLLWVVAWGMVVAGDAAARPMAGLTRAGLAQLEAMQSEKRTWTPVQRKIGARLLLIAKRRRGQAIVQGVPVLRRGIVTLDDDGTVRVDITADVNPVLLQTIEDLGGTVINSFEQFHAIRARVPLVELETLAAEAAVRSIRPPARMRTNKTNTSEGDVAHRAATARSTFGVDGTGVKIGVLSDAVDSLAELQSAGDLPASVTVLPGQAGSGGDEGAAMLEIVHDLAPGADLYFATAFGSHAQFAQNILDLFEAGCQVIVDDINYSDEPALQDGILAQAIDTVTSGGAVYFSAAGNDDNFSSGVSSVWQGDFNDDGEGNHEFATGVSYNTICSESRFIYMLQWADPWGGSGNDYDLYLYDSSGNTMIRASVDSQDGSGNPWEVMETDPSDVGARLVVVKYSGSDRFIHLTATGARLTYNTTGQTWGHANAASAFSVGAVGVAEAGGGSFSSSDAIQSYSSDGPRRMFFDADGNAYTPGDFSATGGTVRQKPDVAGADGVSCAAPGFTTFWGTSAAAPHLAAIAALMIERGTTTPDAIRNVIQNSCWDPLPAGWDRDFGYGIPDAYTAVNGSAYPAPVVMGEPATTMGASNRVYWSHTPPAPAAMASSVISIDRRPQDGARENLASATNVVPERASAGNEVLATPDLAANSINRSSFTVEEGSAYWVQVGIINSGDASADASHVKLYLSTEEDYDTTDDHYVGEKSVIALTPGATTSVRWDFAVPDLGSGIYSVWGVIELDNRDEVAESSEDNTFMGTTPTTVTDPPCDLQTVGFLPQASSVTEGESFNVQVSINNAGTNSAAATHARLYLSTDGDTDVWDDYYVGEQSIPALGSGASSGATWAFTMPDIGNAPYTVTCVCVVDSRDEAYETNESNTFPGSSDTFSAADAAVEFYAECDDNASFTSPTTSGWIIDSQYRFGGLTVGATYHYRVKARQMGVASPWSNVESSQQTEEQGADILDFSLDGSGYVSLGWSDVTDASYTVEWTSNLLNEAWGPVPDGTVWPIAGTGWTSAVPLVDDGFYKVTSDVPD